MTWSEAWPMKMLVKRPGMGSSVLLLPGVYDRLAYKVGLTCHVTFVSGGPWEGSGTEACGATE